LFRVAFDYWKTPFAIVFGMGVVSGVVLSYQFGTNWSVFSDRAGPIIGPLMGYEVFSAFFLEAGFLGIMLFGRDKVGRIAHLVATVMVAAGTLLSAFWILAANSWMQTPAGFTVAENGQFVPSDWWAVIFNPSFPYRLVHMVLAAYLTTALTVGAVAAWHLLSDRFNEAARLMFSMAMWMVALTAPLQIVAGDLHGINSFQHQPAKIAAIEGHFESQRGAPLILFGWPDMEQERTRYAVEVPKLGSLILTHEWDGLVRGLKEWPAEDRPYAPLIFWTFRLMVAIGFAMAALGLASLYCRWRGRLYDTPWLFRAAVAMGPAGFIAILAGWITTEVGRQPYTVYGLLRTAESASPIDAPAVATSFAAFVVVYLVVFGAGTLFLLRMLLRPPGPVPEGLPDLRREDAAVMVDPTMAAGRGREAVP
jgi:cytochrome d ubiquinol oxidase subunit I